MSQSHLPDPTSIIAASIRRYLPQHEYAATAMAEAFVRDLQNAGWLTDWHDISIHGVSARPPIERQRA